MFAEVDLQDVKAAVTVLSLMWHTMQHLMQCRLLGLYLPVVHVEAVTGTTNSLSRLIEHPAAVVQGQWCVRVGVILLGASVVGEN